MTFEPFLTNHEIIVAARRNVADPVWDYITGGSDSETTIRRNRQALDSLAFRPRVLCDVSEIDASATILGHRSRIPVFLAPVASLQIIAPDGALAADDAAEAFGAVNMLSSHTEPDLEAVAANSPHAKMFQLYVRGDRQWTADILARAREAGFGALVLTADTAVYSNRERQVMAGWKPPTRHNPAGEAYQAALDWDIFDAIAEMWGGKMILKGVGTAEDAAEAVAHGAAAVYVSNHGGRQLDHDRGTIAVLPEVVAAVAGRAEVLVDGGFLRGGDVVKAIALGAAGVGIGKLQAWALAAGGAGALVNCLEILEHEIRLAMGLLGVTALDRLGPAHLAPARPVGPCHEMSAFPHLPGGRLT